MRKIAHDWEGDADTVDDPTLHDLLYKNPRKYGSKREIYVYVHIHKYIHNMFCRVYVISSIAGNDLRGASSEGCFIGAATFLAPGILCCQGLSGQVPHLPRWFKEPRLQQIEDLEVTASVGYSRAPM